MPQNPKYLASFKFLGKLHTKGLVNNHTGIFTYAVLTYIMVVVFNSIFQYFENVQ